MECTGITLVFVGFDQCLEQFQSVSNGAFESMWKSLMLCEVFLMLGSIGDAFARNRTTALAPFVWQCKFTDVWCHQSVF